MTDLLNILPYIYGQKGTASSMLHKQKLWNVYENLGLSLLHTYESNIYIYMSKDMYWKQSNKGKGFISNKITYMRVMPLPKNQNAFGVNFLLFLFLK